MTNRVSLIIARNLLEIGRANIAWQLEADLILDRSGPRLVCILQISVYDSTINSTVLGSFSTLQILSTHTSYNKFSFNFS